MSLKIQRQATKLAEGLLSHQDVNPKSTVQVEDLAEDMGISVVYKKLLKDIEGESRVKDGKREIIVNSNSSHYRQRFTIAHELGHILVDDSVGAGFDQIDVSISSENEMEKFCDKFASRLLVPQESINSLSNWSNFTITDAKRRGNELEVSLETIARRILEVAPSDGGYFIFDRDEGINIERPFILRRGVFPTSDIQIHNTEDHKLVIPYNSKYFTELLDVYNSDRECLLPNMFLNLSPFPKLRPLRTAAMGKAHHKKLILVTAPPKVQPNQMKLWEKQSQNGSYEHDMYDFE